MTRSVATGDMLRQIRTVMAREENSQIRLDNIVEIIAKNLRVQVCSIYLHRADKHLELSASLGLSRAAIHATHLTPGEGLVGEVVRKLAPLNVPNVRKHHLFSFHPETGEDELTAFLGVPILRSTRVLGVLVVQDAVEHLFAETVVDDLQNIAMVLAEIVASGELLDAYALHNIPTHAQKPVNMHGVQVVDGLAMGQAILFEPHIVGTSRISLDPEHEAKRISDALNTLRQQLDSLFLGKGHAFGEPTREVMNTYRMFARDESWFARLTEATHAGLTAEAAVERVRGEYRQRFLGARDPYLRERLHDLDDLANRLLRHLGGVSLPTELPDDTILVARNIGPAELLELDRSKLRALVLEEGSRTSHAAIVANAMRLPVIGSLPGVLATIVDGDPILVDAENGEIHIRPSPETKDSFVERFRIRRQRRAAFSKLKDQPAISQDGQRISLFLNAGLEIDLPYIAETGADGIGLFRTEFQFMLSDALPKQAQLTELYAKVLHMAGDRPVIFRTLDLGGDKVLPYVAQERETNPALGWRAIRMAIDRPGMFRYQLRALLHAAAGQTLRIMFPLVSTMAEFLHAKQILEQEQTRLARFGHTNLPKHLKIGCMIETPAMVWQLDQLLPQCDFISVGANDLMQYFFAADRENVRVAGRYDPLHPGALRMMKHIVQQAKKYQTPVSICGEMAGRRIDAAVLLALGIRQLSVPASNIGPLKQMILALDIGVLADELNLWMREDGTDIRKKMQKFAEKAKIHP